MPRLSYIHPLDQPLNRRRLLAELKNALRSAQFDNLCIAVAAVSLGSLLRLDADFRKWKAAGKRIVAIYGVDIGATTIEALNYSILRFNEVYVSRIPGIKFHPKLYIFKGPQRGLVFYGSHNLTVPGTETNFEASLIADYNLPADAAAFADALRGWNDLLTAKASNTVFPLTASLLVQLVSEGLVISEKNLGATSEGGKGSKKTTKSSLPKSSLKKMPPSPLPKELLISLGPIVIAAPSSTAAGVPSPIGSASADTLVMQIKPHANGEVFLSKLAVDQNPAFFGFPFTGRTTPKKARNPSYPQRLPDPIVDIAVYGRGATPVLSLVGYALNTVYYESKSEVRITCAPLVAAVPQYSVMVMSAVAPATHRDYDIEIYRPDSPDYAAWLAVCNQTMPSGGKAARKFGWL